MKKGGNQLVRNEDGYYVPPVEWGDIRNGTTSSAIQVDEAVEQTLILSSQVEVLEGIAEEHTTQIASLEQSKVDKVAGMGLSSNDFTDPLRDKLIGLEGTHWRGTFVSLAALQAGVTDPQAGDYADVDIVGDDVVRYIWDATDGIWVAQSGEVAPITASQVKLLYESNPDTNAFTDADEAKLDGIEAGATVGDAVLRQDLSDPDKFDLVSYGWESPASGASAELGGVIDRFNVEASGQILLVTGSEYKYTNILGDILV